jgi:hypothetical protein
MGSCDDSTGLPGSKVYEKFLELLKKDSMELDVMGGACILVYAFVYACIIQECFH